MDLEGGRRAGTYAEMCDYLKARSSRSTSCTRKAAGRSSRSIFRPRRAISISIIAEITLLDKNWQPQGLGTRTLDRCARNGGDLARHDARGADRQAGLHLHHQHQFALAARHSDGGRPDDLCRAWAMRGGDALHAGRRHVAGDACRRAGAAACGSAGRHRALPDRAAGIAGHVWRLHLQCRHELGRAGLRHARICAGRASLGPAGAAYRRAVPLEQCECGQ